MANVHRRFLDLRQIEEILRLHGIDAPLVEAEVLPGGTFNTVYRLKFADRPSLVLKLSPDSRGTAMTYEHDIVRTEAQFYSLAGELAGLPVPEVIGVSDLDPEQGGGQALLVSELPGVPWSACAVADADRGPLRHRLGELVASMHQVRGPAFGYPSESTGPLTPRWSEAFGAMMDAVLADAVRHRVSLSVSPERVRYALAACDDDLVSVLVPILVHFDLWDGNVLLDLGPDRDREADGDDPELDDDDDLGAERDDVRGAEANHDAEFEADGDREEREGREKSDEIGWRISGIVDGERAMWGDPVIDFASAALLGEIRDDADFIRGYEASGAILPLDKNARRRLLLYRVYLGLIMTVEPIPRGSEHSPEFARAITEHLSADLTELESLAGIVR